MQDASYELLVDRLTAEEMLDKAVEDCLLAAADGIDALNAHLAGTTVEKRDLAPTPAVDPARVYLDEIAVTGFRGIADRARLQLRPGPGLTLVVGRNGSGKSSFAEALELLLTECNLRWDGKAKAWAEGWRNLHAPGTTKVEATFRVDGQPSPLAVSKTWPAGAGLDDDIDRTVSGAFVAWDALGWDEALERYRPLLSYNELGTMFSDRSNQLYDALAAVLGLEDFEAVQATLRKVRLEREQSRKAEKALKTSLKATLGGVDDPRAHEVLQLMACRPPKLGEVQALLLDSSAPDDTAALRRAVDLRVPTTDDLDALHLAAADAQTRVGELEQTDAELQRRLADLLEAAIHVQAHPGRNSEDCPVCGTADVLGPSWSLSVQADVDRMRRASDEVRAARAAAADAQRALEAVFPGMTPTVLGALGSEAQAAHAAWDVWAADKFSRPAADALVMELQALQTFAAEELERLDAAWRAVEPDVMAWLTAARTAAADDMNVANLKAAEDWMKACTKALRGERLEPVVVAARKNWEALRHESNVKLEKVELNKAGNNARAATFAVTVDGSESSAFGVMSQGELTALAISIFLPRAALPQSPFGFIVIDDPVQSMDPAKVDGLARVLAEAAKTRQVIVFTHDERLPQAVDRLAIEATVMNVQRRGQSKVEVVAGSTPSERYIREAIAMAKTTGLPAEVGARVVPGFCRSAIEAACATRIRRAQQKLGTPHAQIDARLAGHTSLNTWLADAFGLEPSQGLETTDRVRQLGGDDAVEVVKLAKVGSHKALSKDPLDLARGAERLVKELEKP